MLINIHSFTRFVGFTRFLSAPFLFLSFSVSNFFALFLSLSLFTLVVPSLALFLLFCQRTCSICTYIFSSLYFPPTYTYTRDIHTNPYTHAHKAHTHKTTIRTGTPLLMTHNTLLSALVYSCSGSRGISSVRSVFDAANAIGLITFLSSKKRGLGSRFRVFAASNI